MERGDDEPQKKIRGKGPLELLVPGVDPPLTITAIYKSRRKRILAFCHMRQGSFALMSAILQERDTGERFLCGPRKKRIHYRKERWENQWSFLREEDAEAARRVVEDHLGIMD